uniref:Uncharacterized protein n=1 Tax=Rhizophora mucronata TaxID=61149 RepID=A0A2P2PJZ9_RHIMU
MGKCQGIGSGNTSNCLWSVSYLEFGEFISWFKSFAGRKLLCSWSFGWFLE